MAATTYRIRGVQPPDLRNYPADVRLLFWAWVVEFGLAVKDRELARGLDKDGEPLRAISPRTRRYRRSAMTPDGKGDPSAPPLMPARQLSRTRSLLAGRATDGAAVFYWRFDAFTGDSWGKVLAIQAKKGRDVIGLSPKGVARVRALAWERWGKWKAGTLRLAAAARTESPGIPEVGSYSTANATFGIGAQSEAKFAKGQWSGGMTWPEWQRYFRRASPAPVAIPGRPAGNYNRILAHTWGTTKPPAAPTSPARPLPGDRRPSAGTPAKAPAAAPGTPLGIPLSRALDIPRGRFADRLRAALSAVDRVHGDGRLPRIPVEPYDDDDGYLGVFEATGTPGGDARPRRIRSFTGQTRPELNLVHELGHFIEGFAIPGDRKMARDWDRDPNLAAWKAAVEDSKAWKALRSLVGMDYVRGEKDGKAGRIRVNQDDVAYLLEWDELWARSYAQYIAVRSGDGTLRTQVDAARNRSVHGIYFHRQWDEADFEPIAAAIDGLFRGLRWRT